MNIQDRDSHMYKHHSSGDYESSQSGFFRRSPFQVSIFFSQLFQLLAVFSLHKRACVLTLLSVAILHGCVAVQPFPTYAKKKDTVVLMLGYSDHVDRSAVEVYYDDPNSVDPESTRVKITEKIRSIFKLYPDKRSNAWRNYAGLSNYGRAMDVMVLDLPEDIPVGNWNIIVDSGMEYASDAITPNDVVIPLEIIPGTGAKNDFFVHQTTTYNNPSQAPVNLSVLEINDVLQVNIDANASDVLQGSGPRYGAVEIKVSGLFTANPFYLLPFVEAEDITWNDYSQRQVFHSYDNSAGEGVLTINFVSPAFGLIRSEINAYVLRLVMANSSPQVDSVKYYDLNGALTSGPDVKLHVCSSSSGCQCINSACMN